MADKEYLRIAKNILEKGKWKQNRTGVRALTIPFQTFTHDMSDGFPLLTCRKLPFKSTAIELEGFLKGITDKKWYQDQGCKYWNFWANPQKVNQKQINWQNENVKNYTKDNYKQCVVDSDALRKDFQYEENDLGPVYGYQWRNFGQQYGEVEEVERESFGGLTYHEQPNGLAGGFDQIKNIVEKLEKDPHDRRMIASAWNPNQFNIMALPPCHVLHMVTVIEDTIHLCYFQRSNDYAVGNCANFASYALLLLLYAKQSGFKPGTFTGFLGDVHIYENHIEQVKLMIERNETEQKDSPQLEITIEKPFEIIDNKLQVNWTHKDYKLHNYNPWPKIDMGEIAV